MKIGITINTHVEAAAFSSDFGPKIRSVAYLQDHLLWELMNSFLLTKWSRQKFVTDVKFLSHKRNGSSVVKASDFHWKIVVMS